MHVNATPDPDPSLLDRIATMQEWQCFMLIHSPIRPSQAELNAAVARLDWLRKNPPPQRRCNGAGCCLQGKFSGPDGLAYCRVCLEMEEEPGGRYF